MKTIYKYEASDIKMTSEELNGEQMDPVQSFLFGQILYLFLVGPKPKDGETPMMAIKRLVADFLNAAQDAGISITVAEQVPDVFRGM